MAEEEPLLAVRVDVHGDQSTARGEEHGAGVVGETGPL